MAASNELFHIRPEVRAALAAGRPIVALESTLITHGLPRPDNLAAAHAAEAAIRAQGATPATIALRDGRVLVGLVGDELEQLAAATDLPKVSRQNLAAVLGATGWGGTTVSATMIAAHVAGIEAFATGGIGGVHRGGGSTMDISADLEELARTPVVVVCAGPKSILDVGRTLEALETRGVPVVAWQSDEVAGFYSRSSGHPASQRVDDATTAAGLIRRQWQLGLGGGVLITVPLPDELAIPAAELDAVIEQAAAEAVGAGIHGPASTPWVLRRIAVLTEGRSVRANIALIEQNASVAGAIAVALAERS